MFNTHRRLFIVAFLFVLSTPAFAEDKCSVKAVLGGKPVAMKSCAAAIYEPSDDQYSVAGAPFSGRQWVFALPKDKDILKIEKLTGSIAPGGKISGRITGGKVSDGLKYSWEADFEFTLPAKSAFAGLGSDPEARRRRAKHSGQGPRCQPVDDDAALIRLASPVVPRLHPA